MDRSDVIKLIAVCVEPDEIGQQIEVETGREIFCSISSISAAEFFDAGRSGLKAALRATVFEPEYEGEEIAEYRGVRYAIYRTFRAKNEQLELYLRKDVGA